MNEELTMEVLEDMKKCNGYCANCKAHVLGETTFEIRKLATALLEERAKPKVWEGAPGWADRADVSYKGNVNSKINISIYTRDLPKTRARQIAENIVHGINGKTHGETKDIEYVECVLTKYAEELKGEA